MITLKSFTRKSLCLSIGSVFEHVVLENATKYISKHLKWSSGLRLMIIVGRSVARSLRRSVSRSLDKFTSSTLLVALALG